MRAMRIHQLRQVTDDRSPLNADEIPIPQPARGEVLIRVLACGVCHTELDEIENRTPPARLPMTPGHQVVGEVVAEGPGCERGLGGRRVGVAWIHAACGHCDYCRRGLENLCPDFQATGRDVPGGYAEYLTAREPFVYPLPAGLDTLEAAPLLCAGAVGLRALRLAEPSDGAALGLTGFGSSGQLVLQLAHHLLPASPVFVFARSPLERELALDLGAAWAGDTTDAPPRKLQAVIDTTPAWRPVLSALAALEPGGRLVINAIRKEAGDAHLLAELEYERHLWHEKQLRSVANVTRADVEELLQLALEIPLRPRIATYKLEEAGAALLAIRAGHIAASCVLVP